MTTTGNKAQPSPDDIGDSVPKPGTLIRFPPYGGASFGDYSWKVYSDGPMSVNDDELFPSDSIYSNVDQVYLSLTGNKTCINTNDDLFMILGYRYDLITLNNRVMTEQEVCIDLYWIAKSKKIFFRIPHRSWLSYLDEQQSGWEYLYRPQKWLNAIVAPFNGDDVESIKSEQL